MDHHCAWIDNCVGVLNFNWYMRFCALIVMYHAPLALRFVVELLWVSKDPSEVGLSPLNMLWYAASLIGLCERQEINWGWYVYDSFVFSLMVFYTLYPYGVY